MQRPFVVLILRQVLFFLEKCFAQYLEILGCADFFTGGDERACHREARFHDVARVVFTLAADCHSESINIEFEKPFEMDELLETLKNAPGVVLQNNSAANEYPLAVDAAGHDEVFIGRVRRDESVESGVNIWVVADNIRKGAATNAVQIAEEIIKNMQ